MPRSTPGFWNKNIVPKFVRNMFRNISLIDTPSGTGSPIGNIYPLLKSTKVTDIISVVVRHFWASSVSLMAFDRLNLSVSRAASPSMLVKCVFFYKFNCDHHQNLCTVSKLVHSFLFPYMVESQKVLGVSVDD